MEPNKQASLLTEEIKKNALALSSLRMASDTFDHLSKFGLEHDPVIRSALFHAGVIHYGRPFKKSKFLGKKIIYPVSQIKDAKNYSNNIHLHLLDLRDELIAHSDDTMLPPEIAACWMAVTKEENTKLSENKNATPLSIAAKFGILKTLDSKGAEMLIMLHVKGVSDKVFEILANKLKKLFLLYKNYPSEFTSDDKVIGQESFKSEPAKPITISTIANTLHSKLNLTSKILFREDYSFLKFVTEIGHKSVNELFCSTTLFHEYPHQKSDSDPK